MASVIFQVFGLMGFLSFFQRQNKPGFSIAVWLAVGMALLLMSSNGVSAHNWVHSSSRSLSASTYPPCKAPLTDIPHIQVGPGQEFSIEWMTGHGFPTYFVVVHVDNADKMALNTVTLLDNYLANAPAGSNTAQTPRWSKYHRKPTNNVDNDLAENPEANFFKRVVPTTDQYFIPRPLATGRTDNLYQLEYKPEQLVGDLRATYANADYPWIVTAAKFYIKTMAANRFDTARFVIPANAAPGRYIVQYLWRGYRDCVDVEVKDAVVSEPYGFISTQSLWARIDHCLFQNVRNILHTSEIVTDPTWCLDRCVTSGSCEGVNVVPMRAPPTAYQGFDLNSLNPLFPNIYGTDLYVPWNHTYFVNKPYLRNALIANTTHTHYMCYTVQPRLATTTEDEYTLATDPQDPLFYSTCFFRLSVSMFEDYALNYQSSKMNVPWRFHDQCIDCELRELNSYPRTTPRWDLAHACVNCDKEPQPSIPAPQFPQPILVGNNVRCDGADNTTSRAAHHTCTGNATDCHKPLIPAGRERNHPVSLEECFAMVAKDAECDGWFTYANRSTSPKCICHKKTACCKTCSRIPATNYHVYQLRTAPDPACSKGTLSADTKSCCSAECGAGNCTTTTGAKDPVGFCCSTCIPPDRTCDKFGPPCVVSA